MDKIIKGRAKALRHMDNVIRMMSDEENGIFEAWISLHVPDESSDEDLEEFASDEHVYIEACMFFASNIAELIDCGDWNKDGYSLELFNTDAYLKGRKQ